MNNSLIQHERVVMDKISIPWMIDVIEAIDGLERVQPKLTIGDCFIELYSAKHTLGMLFTYSIYKTYLRISQLKANELFEAIEELIPDEDVDLELVISESKSWQIQELKKDLRLVFLQETSTIPIYLVSPKECYDVAMLLESGQALFPKEILTKAPETAMDMSEVGQCLAYERNTACGFHTFRVVESVLRRYWKEVSDEEADQPKPMTLGNIASQLKKNEFGSEKAVEALKQMSRLHRNPIAHPDVILTSDEAIAAIGMARSVITAMLSELPEVPQTTGLPLISKED